MERTTPASLAVDNVRQVYGDVVALDGVSIGAARGEIVCLLGHSGCGKTTLLRIAAGLERPTAGRVLLDGREVTGPATFVPPEKRGVGLMFQDYALFPHLSIADNVAFGLTLRSPAEAADVAIGLLARVGLEDFAGAYPHMLSAGEQQRVALVRAIAPRPGVLLMDEPFSNLDPRLRDGVRDETIALLRETGSTAVIVTHDPEEALRIAGHIVLMHEGRVMQSGAAQDLYDRPASLFVARFFCDFNEIGGIAHDGEVMTPLGRFPAGHVAEGAPAVVCVRPQDVRLVAAGASAPGRIVSRQFLGDEDLIGVTVEGLAEPLQARVRRGAAPAMRTAVGVEVSRERALVLA